MGRICFVVGHGKSKSGGYDPGATNGNYHEFKIACEIARYAQAFYNANYSEVADLMNYDGTIYLNDRIKKLKTDKYDFVAEFHLNAGGGTGTECYYSHTSATGKKYAEAITKHIAAAFGIKNRGAKIRLNSAGTADYFGIIRSTKPEAVLIETVFIDSADVYNVATAAGQKKCGEAIAQAVADVRGLKANNTATTAKPATAVTEKNTATASKYFAKYTGKSNSLVDALKAIKVDSAYSYRKKIATANGVKLYVGTAKQNTQLLSLLKQGKLIKP